MVNLSSFAFKKHTLRRKLFSYMFILAILLLGLFFAGVFLIMGFTCTRQKFYKTLDFQSQVFERQISSHFNNLAVMGIQLAEESDHIIASYLKENALDFEQLNGSEIRLSSLQEALFDTLEHKLLEADCTSAFILLNAQVNPSVENASVSRSGLYLQRSSLDSSDNHILLYRGLAAIGKKQGCMPHRKWRLEFRPDHVPDFEHIKEKADLPLFSSYQLTDMFTLPGTSERVMLLALPLTGSDGTFFGLCGFEISESYFKHVFAQPSSLSRVLFCLCSGNDGLADTRDCFSAGIVNDYYLAPSGTYHTQNFGNGLKCFQNDTSSYIGISNPVHLCPGDVPFSVSVLMPFTDYRTQAIADGLRILLLLLLSLSAAASCCLYFSHRYLIPVYQSIQRICQKEYDASDTSIAEIDDLFAFLAEQDRINEAALEKIKAENATAQASLKQMYSEQQENRQQIERLAYSRKTEVDPYDYENFLMGIKELTETERKVFGYYLQGKTVKEIMELSGVKESTIRFHNRNIYSKLQVSSLKQLLRFASIMKQDDVSQQKNKSGIP